MDNKSKLSPMMKQYLHIKEQHKDEILFFRLGDFYEMFFDDAITVSKVLDLTLTGKNCGLSERAPMCGIPYHAADAYIAKLISAGFKVAVCEQTSGPEGKGIFERQITHLATAGTFINDEYLNPDCNNYLMSIYFDDCSAGVSWADISTGELNHEFIQAPVFVKLNDILSRLNPAEIICNSLMLQQSLELSAVKYGNICPFSQYNDAEFEYESAFEYVKNQLKPENIKQLQKTRQCVQSAGALLSYINYTQKRPLAHLNYTVNAGEQKLLTLDINTRKTLELVESGNKAKGSLFGQINNTSTPMGARNLKKMIEQPLVDGKIINQRLDAVEKLLEDAVMLNRIQNALSNVKDIERLTAKLSCGLFGPKKCVDLRQTLKIIPEIKDCLKSIDCSLLNELNLQIDDFKNLYNLLNDAISENPSDSLSDGKVIKEGYDEKIDKYRKSIENIEDSLSAMEQAEKLTTGIKGLKISDNRIFGYYIEVPKTQQELVPFRYERRQTVANAERYITKELKELEEIILNGQQNLLNYETEVYNSIINEIIPYIQQLLSTARAIIYLDCLVSFALCSRKNNYVKPVINETIRHIKINDGRHPIAEKLLTNEQFVPNDTFIDDEQSRIMLITGPNMAGKSLYMRQVALICILAHMGCFVPAKSAEISILDRIFTRVGANDDILTGRSTFMVEMSEVSDILSFATDNSLILMDEIGRGTATYDGLSIAWSIIEYLSQTLKCKVLFSTHYHELTELEGVIDGIKNYKLAAKDYKNTIIFLRKLLRGSSNKSFGIEVAALAGLPENVIVRAKDILKKLEDADIAKQAKPASNQLSFFNEQSNINEVLLILTELDIDNISPRHALEILGDLKDKVKG